MELDSAPLGKQSAYIDTYTPSLLFPLPRATKRHEIGIDEQALPFKGLDLWTGYELSWLNNKGKPVVAVAHFSIPCQSPNLIESKSFKLYLNSFNNSKFVSMDEVKALLLSDLSAACGAPVTVSLYGQADFAQSSMTQFDGECLDQLDVVCDVFDVTPALLNSNDKVVTETLYSNLLKSNCLVTGQPDWGSIQISYRGPKLNRENLLKYIVSYRNHNEFHEQCVERIFNDIRKQAKPESLTVYARYTRRGGLDINPYRSTEDTVPADNTRHYRQ